MCCRQVEGRKQGGQRLWPYGTHAHSRSRACVLQPAQSLGRPVEWQRGTAVAAVHWAASGKPACKPQAPDNTKPSAINPLMYLAALDSQAGPRSPWCWHVPAATSVNTKVQ